MVAADLRRSQIVAANCPVSRYRSASSDYVSPCKGGGMELALRYDGPSSALGPHHDGRGLHNSKYLFVDTHDQ